VHEPTAPAYDPDSLGEDTQQAVAELAGGAAHHLNNLLTIVVGRVQLLLRSATDEQVRRSLSIVERASKDAAEVVRRLQQFARTRRVELPSMVDVNALAEEVIGLVQAHLQTAGRAKDATIEIECRLGTVPAVRGDADGLREALTSVLRNAVEAIPRRGVIVVATTIESGSVAVTVSDSGIGMSPEVRRRAPEPFFTTKGVKSTGLGLSVAYGIARRHGGALIVESEPGHGTTVTLRLPAPFVTPPPSPVLVSGAAPPLRILLVDDEAEVRHALAEMLSAQGHAVVTAASGDEAMARVEADPAFELVLTDLVMPGMTGRDLATAVKARRPRLPVGIITGWGETDEIEVATREGVDFVIEKPVSLEALNEAVARIRR
jgi:CheY-like chemotaxis protein/two-component sensor histidine kinase